jgi:Malectin domain/IPT/TIG domain
MVRKKLSRNLSIIFKMLRCALTDSLMSSTGSLYVAKYKAGKIRYLIPLETASTTLVVKSVFPRRGGQAGGNVLSIFGEKFDSGGTPAVSVGRRACPVLSFTASKITCTLPGGSGTADIVVTTGSNEATFAAGYRYITGSPMPAQFLVARINCGGNAYTDTAGNTWEADSTHAYYSPGGAVSVTTIGIVNTDDDTLYQSNRPFKRNKPGPYRYVIPVPVAGEYVVTLHFAETDPFRDAVGDRKVDIWVEGTLSFAGFDIVKEAGAAFTALNITTTVTVTDGSVAIELKPIKSNPMISAIAVYGIGK